MMKPCQLRRIYTKDKWCSVNGALGTKVAAHDFISPFRVLEAIIMLMLICCLTQHQELTKEGTMEGKYKTELISLQI